MMPKKYLSPIRLHPNFMKEMSIIRGNILSNPNNNIRFKDISYPELSRRILEAPSWQQVKQELIEQNRRANTQNPLVFNIGIRIKKDKRRIFDL